MYAFSGIAPAPASEPLGPGCVCPGGTVWAATPQRGPGQPPNICVRAPGVAGEGAPFQATPRCPADIERDQMLLGLLWIGAVVGGLVILPLGALWAVDYFFERGG